MLFKVSDVAEHNKDLDSEEKIKWVRSANSVLKEFGTDKTSRAIKIANSAINISKAMTGLKDDLG